jgi:NADH:ubiquinone oxidoreductase subunit F (NADH-binding)
MATTTAHALPRLLAPDERWTAPPSPVRGGDPQLVDAIDRAGLRGRGGASFPTATKMRAVLANTKSGVPVVVANGTEGEPASTKDKLLLTRCPHLVLDGALGAAAAVGANQIVIAIDRHARAAHVAMTAALASRADAIPIDIAATPAHYVAGEESALVHFLNGGEAKPTTVPPRPFERGFDRRPTLVQNTETLAHLALIARHGVQWFRQMGTVTEPGTCLATVSLGAQRGQVLEVAFGTPLSAVLRSGHASEIQAVLVGGYYGAWVGADAAATAALSIESLKPYGAALGCGALVGLPLEACGLRETANVLTWMAGETAGQCGPCVHGLAAIAQATTKLADGRGTTATVDQLHRWASQITGRGGCKFPDGAVRFLRSALTVFAVDVDRHLHAGPCPASRRAGLLPTPPTRHEPWR